MLAPRREPFRHFWADEADPVTQHQQAILDKAQFGTDHGVLLGGDLLSHALWQDGRWEIPGLYQSSFIPGDARGSAAGNIAPCLGRVSSPPNETISRVREAIGRLRRCGGGPPICTRRDAESESSAAFVVFCMGNWTCRGRVERCPFLNVEDFDARIVAWALRQEGMARVCMYAIERRTGPL